MTEDIRPDPAVDPIEQPPAAETEPDPNDVVPVPSEMYPAEVDARGDAVNALREAEGLPLPESHDEDRGASYA